MVRDDDDMVFGITIGMNRKIPEAIMVIQHLVPKRTGCDPNFEVTARLF
jgi:hypothetical protein